MAMKIVPSLCFRNPKEVYAALVKNEEVKKWLNFISNHYVPPKVKIFLIYPCSSIKPYHKSRSYKILFNTLAKLGEKRKHVHVLTISEPFGIVPEEFYGKKTKWHDWKNRWYDCPGLFEWWCRRHNQPYSKEYLEKSIELLASYVAKFLEKLKTRDSCPKVVAFIRTFSSRLEIRDDYTHRKIIEKAAKITDLNVEILPDKKLVQRIVATCGRMAWDMYGVAHPLAQEYLLRYLEGVLDDAGN
jgi:archaeosine synthase